MSGAYANEAIILNTELPIVSHQALTMSARRATESFMMGLASSVIHGRIVRNY